MEKVTKEEFYIGIGQQDVVVKILPGPWPYTVEFVTRYQKDVRGRIVPEDEHGLKSAYYLPK